MKTILISLLMLASTTVMAESPVADRLEVECNSIAPAVMGAYQARVEIIENLTSGTRMAVIYQEQDNALFGPVFIQVKSRRFTDNKYVTYSNANKGLQLRIRYMPNNMPVATFRANDIQSGQKLHMTCDFPVHAGL